jgi:hypothetical protein
MVKYAELLPEKSFAILNTTGETILIKRGENGYYPQDSLKNGDVDELNETLGVTKAQAEAMYHASLFGWDIPASNPTMWEENGILTHNRKKQ